jgi:hypothetical protein
MASREICKICFHVNRVGFNVPEEIWRAVVPAELQKSVVCLDCFSRLADEKLIRWDASIALYPVSMATHLGLSSGDDVRAPVST